MTKAAGAVVLFILSICLVGACLLVCWQSTAPVTEELDPYSAVSSPRQHITQVHSGTESWGGSHRFEVHGLYGSGNLAKTLGRKPVLAGAGNWYGNGGTKNRKKMLSGKGKHTYSDNWDSPPVKARKKKWTSDLDIIDSGVKDTGFSSKPGPPSTMSPIGLQIRNDPDGQLAAPSSSNPDGSADLKLMDEGINKAPPGYR